MAGNYRYISEQEKKLVITMSLRGMKVKDIELKLWLLRLQNLQGSTAVCIGMTRLLHLEEGHREREAQRAAVELI